MSRRKGAGRPAAGEQLSEAEAEALYTEFWGKPKAKPSTVAVVEIVPLYCETCGELHIGDEWESWYANPRGTKCPGGGK